MIELSYAVVNIGKELSFYKKMEGIAEVLSIFSLMYIYLVYVFIMFLIAIDRFLKIYLNIKYRILWSPKKKMVILLFGVMWSFFALIPFYLNRAPKIYLITSKYMFRVTEAIFVIVASTIYFHITKQVLIHQRKLYDCESSCKQTTKLPTIERLKINLNYLHQLWLLQHLCFSWPVQISLVYVDTFKI